MLRHTVRFLQSIPLTLRVVCIATVFLLTIWGQFGSFLSLVATCGAFVVVFDCGARLLVRLGVSLCSSRDGGQTTFPVDNLDDPRTIDLTTRFREAQQIEQTLTDRYNLSACSAEDVVRSRALRLKAEIDLLRYRQGPRTWQQECVSLQELK